MGFAAKTGLASIRITSEKSIILSVNSEDEPVCFYFENINQFTETLKKKQFHIKQWVVSIPDAFCITKVMELPTVNMDQAYNMVEFEISTYLPLPAESLVYGCVPLISDNANLLKVAVYILKVKTLENILVRFKSVGITISKIMVDSVVVGSWFGLDRNSDADQINILFTKDSLFLYLVKSGYFQRHEEIPLSDTIENQKEDIIHQINYLASELLGGKQPVLKIAADVDIQPQIKKLFEADFSSIEFLEPPDLNSFVEGNLPEKDYVFDSVVSQGLLKAAEDPDFKFLNLLGAKILNIAKRKKFVINIIVTTATCLFAVFCLWFNFQVKNWRIQYACQKITNEIAPIKHIAADVENKRQKVKAIQAQLSGREQISDFFSQLYKYSPRNITINHVVYSSVTGTVAINIKGQSETLSDAFEYSEAMKDAKLLRNTQIINAQQIPRPGGSVVEFKAECMVGGGGGAEKAL